MAGEQGESLTPGTPEYDAAMVAKAEAVLEPKPEVNEDAPAAPEGEQGRPDWLPQKFNTPEDLAKAYAELEQKQGGKAPEGEAKETEGEPEGEAPAEADEAEKAVAAAGLDYDALTAEFTEKGALSEESYKALQEKAGLSREVVDGYIAGQEALAREAQTRAFDIAGGETEYGNMVKWASANLTPAEIQAYDTAIEGTPEQVALAVAGLKSKYVAANGSEPALLNGGSGITQAPQGFKSKAEMTAAMKDPRYAKDAAYRKSVEQKIAISDIF